MATHETEVALARARAASTRENAVRAAGEALSAELLDAMKAAGISKAEKSVNALRFAGLDTLLAEGLARGKVTYRMVAGDLDRLRKALVDRTLSANDIKLGILAFDESAQRLAMVAGKNGSFTYAHAGNRARDSLITFARSLHR